MPTGKQSEIALDFLQNHALQFQCRKAGQKERGGKRLALELVYCLGPPGGLSCHHSGRLELAALPDWDWYDISAHLECTKCGTVGYVDTRVNWSEVIDFNKGVC